MLSMPNRRQPAGSRPPFPRVGHVLELADELGEQIGPATDHRVGVADLPAEGGLAFRVRGSGLSEETGDKHCPAFPYLARGREPGTPGCADGASKGMDCHRLTPIDVAAMSNPNDLDDQDGFHDGVDDSVVADSDPSLIVCAFYLF